MQVHCLTPEDHAIMRRGKLPATYAYVSDHRDARIMANEAAQRALQSAARHRRLAGIIPDICLRCGEDRSLVQLGFKHVTRAVFNRLVCQLERAIMSAGKR